MEPIITNPEEQATALAAVNSLMNSLDVRQATRATYSRQVAAFIAWIYATGRVMQSLSPADIVEYKEHLLSTRSTSTTAVAIAAIRQLYQLVEDNGGNNIARRVHAPKVRKTFVRQHLTPTEARAVIAAAKTLRDKAIITLMLATGIREIEATRLNIADISVRHVVTADGVEISKRIAHVWGKGRDEADATVVIPAAAWNVLAEYIATRRVSSSGEPLFVGESNRNSGERLTTRTIRNIVTTAMHAAGIAGKEYSTHSLRHTAAVAALRQGSAITDVQSMLRHRSPTITKIYLDSIRAELRLTHAAEDNAATYLGL